MFCSIHDFNFLIDKHKNLRASLSWDLRKKETFACAIFGKICYVACAINRAGKLICLRACLYERGRTGLIDKPAWNNQKIGGFSDYFRGSRS